MEWSSLKRRKLEDGIAAIPVCIVSGVAEKPNASSAAGFIKKPIEFDGLLKFVRKFCGTYSSVVEKRRLG